MCKHGWIRKALEVPNHIKGPTMPDVISYKIAKLGREMAEAMTGVFTIKDPCQYCGHPADAHLPGVGWGPECPWPNALDLPDGTIRIDPPAYVKDGEWASIPQAALDLPRSFWHDLGRVEGMLIGMTVAGATREHASECSQLLETVVAQLRAAIWPKP